MSRGYGQHSCSGHWKRQVECSHSSLVQFSSAQIELIAQNNNNTLAPAAQHLASAFCAAAAGLFLFYSISSQSA